MIVHGLLYALEIPEAGFQLFDIYYFLFNL